MSDDDLLLINWKVTGVKKILDGLQTSDLFKENSDVFFVLSNELQDALAVLEQYKQK